MPVIVQKEALYCAIGRCALKLKAYIPFEQWAAESLVVEARSSDPKSVLVSLYSPLVLTSSKFSYHQEAYSLDDRPMGVPILRVA